MKILIENGANIKRYSIDIEDEAMIKLIKKHFPKAKRCNIDNSEYIDGDLVRFEIAY
jgi:uncharacterized protein YxjI